MRCQFHFIALLVENNFAAGLCWKSYSGNKEDLAHHYCVHIIEPFTLLAGEVITFSFFFFFSLAPIFLLLCFCFKRQEITACPFESK